MKANFYGLVIHACECDANRNKKERKAERVAFTA